ncbi:RNA polymerase sigma factor [Kordia sp.]|uniref:RNA polymerase sigma factor n=1 Tax=Kordia sp. TaxID=1965332 RepID=UPI0025B9944E|nr:RNA polymerase sigma factor [Kordia sp.]MCH2192815.1 RNA polymerase sigma factor [Kordia sp.]
MDTDFELIKKIKEGDRSVFRYLVERHKDVSLSLACSIVKDSGKAEDVLQEAFIKVFKKLDSFQFNAAFTTWLYRIVINTSYNAIKKDKNRYPFSQEAEEKLQNTADIPIDKLKAKDQKKYINLALEKLRPDEALVLRLFYLCELKISEITESTGFSISKIKVDLSRGRKNINFQLRKLLGTEIDNLL